MQEKHFNFALIYCLSLLRNAYYAFDMQFDNFNILVLRYFSPLAKCVTCGMLFILGQDARNRSIPTYRRAKSRLSFVTIEIGYHLKASMPFRRLSQDIPKQNKYYL